MRREHDIAVQDDEPCAGGVAGAVVARHGGTGVLLGDILKVALVFVARHYLAARNGRAVLHHDHLGVGSRLRGDGTEQFVELLGAIVDGYDYGIFHLPHFI